MFCTRDSRIESDRGWSVVYGHSIIPWHSLRNSCRLRLLHLSYFICLWVLSACSVQLAKKVGFWAVAESRISRRSRSWWKTLEIHLTSHEMFLSRDWSPSKKWLWFYLPLFQNIVDLVLDCRKCWKVVLYHWSSTGKGELRFFFSYASIGLVGSSRVTRWPSWNVWFPNPRGWYWFRSAACIFGCCSTSRWRASHAVTWPCGIEVSLKTFRGSFVPTPWPPRYVEGIVSTVCHCRARENFAHIKSPTLYAFLGFNRKRSDEMRRPRC